MGLAQRAPAYLGLLTLAYFVVVGGGSLALIDPFRLVNAALAVILVLLWLRSMRCGSDIIDTLMVAGLVLSGESLCPKLHASTTSF